MLCFSEDGNGRVSEDMIYSQQLCVCVCVCVFFFFFLSLRFKGNRENQSDHGSQNRAIEPQFERFPFFWHRPVLKLKRTMIMRGSRFFRSDSTVRSGFQNHAFRLEEITNNCYQQLEDERKKRSAAIQTLIISEHNVADLKKKLTSEEQPRRSSDSALEGVERQVEEQRKRLRETADQLTAAQEQVAALKKQLEEAQRLKDQVEKSKAEAEKARIEGRQETRPSRRVMTLEWLRSRKPLGQRSQLCVAFSAPKLGMKHEPELG